MKTNNTREKILSSNLFPVVGIGASAGGLDAFKKLLKAIPEDSGMAYVLVQHLHPTHESMLPELLQKVTAIPVMEIMDDMKVEPDHIYIIPSNKMLVANDGVLQLSPRPDKIKNERNHPIDLFFKSLAEVHQDHAIGVVLSGTATDGTLGLKAIKDHGGISFAQDEASAEYDGMPLSAVHAGVVDFVLAPQDIPKKLLEIKKRISIPDEELVHFPQAEEEVFKQILSLLRIRKGTDFTYYKQTTIRRRILRRMALNKNHEPIEYLSFLRENKLEQDALYQDLLIPVTEFFRDAKVFDNLCKSVFPNIVENKQPGESIRIWVTACSTGQEAYSIAICLKEYLGNQDEKFQIFATDISEPAITKARRGVYSKNELTGVSPQRLQEFFIKTNDGFQVIKSIRDSCVFAAHNFIKDPPFGKMDFISCRNVLIYMEPYLQKKALTTFHYAINPKGFLLLGKSETSTSVPDLFVPVSKNEKLYTRKNVPGKPMHVASQRSESNMNYHNVSSPAETPRTDFQKTADDIMLSKYTPAGVVVNEEMDIVHFRGVTGNYLEQFPGKPSHNLLKMARQGLAFELRNIIHKAKKENKTVLKENIPININEHQHMVSIEAIPLPNLIDRHYLILFHDNNSINSQQTPAAYKKRISSKTKKDDKDLLIMQLEKELAQAREDMRSITEDQEAANEELQSANEELLSGSEELQSLNEELETSKEELQSTNEELTVVNHEIINLNHQVTSSRDYAEAIIATIREPLLVLDQKLRVRSANSAYYKLFKTEKKDTEGKHIYKIENKEWDIPAVHELLEKILPEKFMQADIEITHAFSNMGERIMLLNAREIINTPDSDKLILLAIEDITEKAGVIKKIEDTNKRYHLMLMQSPFAFSIMKGKDMVISLANDMMKRIWGKGKNVEGKALLELLPELIDQPFPAMIQSVYITGKPVNANEIVAHINHNGILEEKYFDIFYQPHLEADNSISGVITIAHDVTEKVITRKQCEESERHFRQLADLVPAKISNADATGSVTYFNQQWLDFTGLAFEELKELGYHKIMHPDEIVEFQKQFQKASETLSVLKMEMRFLNKKGKYIWHLNIASPVLDEKGNIKLWVGVTTDISEQIKIRNLNLENYTTHSKELEEKVLQRTAELSQINDELHHKNEELIKSNHELESFTYISSHDLQEPLRKIQTFANLIIDKEYAVLSANGKDYFNRMHSAALRMQTLIQDLLAYSHANVTDRKFEKVNLSKLIDEVKKELFEMIHEKKAVIVSNKLDIANVNTFQMRQVINNLIINSLKFSKPDLAPLITIKTEIASAVKLQKQNPELTEDMLDAKMNYCHIIFSDNGIGFEQHYKDRIFDVFQRLHSKEEYPGTGIGLAIVKKIIENHNGIITANGELGKGATFDIYIPA